MSKSIPNRAPELVAASATTWSLAVIFIGLRFLSRRIRHIPLWLDDWLILFALFWSSAHAYIIACFQVSHGNGKHIYDNPPNAAYYWALGLYMAEFVYVVGLVIVKWAILAFYWRIFSILNSMKLVIRVLFGITCAWGIANVFLTIFQCIPVQSFWTQYDPVNPLPPTEYYCGVNPTQFFWGNAIPNIITDILIIVTPIPYILQSQLRRPQKLAVAGIFLVGIMVVIFSVLRFVYTVTIDFESEDVTWNFVNLSLWSIIEENVAIIGGKHVHLRLLNHNADCVIPLFLASLPALKPIFEFMITGTLHSKSDGTEGSSGISRPRNDTSRSRTGTLQKSRIADDEDAILSPPADKNRKSFANQGHPFVFLSDEDSEHSVSLTKDAGIELKVVHAGPSRSISMVSTEV